MSSCIPGLSAYNKTVTRAPLSSRDGSGDPTFGAQTTVRAQVVKINKKAVDVDGNQIEANHEVRSPDTILIDDRLWLPALAGQPADNVADPLAGRRIIDLAAFPSVDGTVTIYEATI